ncbi:MAG: Rrf2 family transcriptional regulator [Clostridium sp.]|uniref:RrF2 family transcriptional regulator n=1 Tax=Clostridium sp. TaxID=1506 RepID=UPI002FC8CDB5
MQLSKFTDYGFRALIYLAKNSDSHSTVEKLACELEVSHHHLKKVINKLGKSGFIIAEKGRGGGLKLGDLPENINLGKVLLVTEDNLNLVECMGDNSVCPLISEGCRLKGVINRALESFINEMSKYTLGDIL